MAGRVPPDDDPPFTRAGFLFEATPAEQRRFWDTVDAPFVGDGFTRWVDGQYALGKPEVYAPGSVPGSAWSVTVTFADVTKKLQAAGLTPAPADERPGA